MRQDKDRAGHWLIEHFGDLALKLAAVRDIATCRAVKGDLVAPRRFPDGLLEVTFTDRPGKEFFLVEIEVDADPDADRQMFEDLMALALDRRPIPEGIILVLRPKGNARVAGRYELARPGRRTGLGGWWQVVELWTLEAADLLAQNDVGLVPWVPLTHYAGPPEELLKECRERIERDAPPERHEGLLAVTRILAGAVYDRGLVEAIFGRIAMKGFLDIPIVKDFIDEQVAERLAKEIDEHVAERIANEVAKRREQEHQAGRRAVWIESIVENLAVRFGSVPDDLQAQITAITDDARLTDLHRFAITCTDLEAFRVRLMSGGQ
jgi:hypothetical protein